MLKVLIVEDDLMIAETAQEVLIDAGYDVCGIARTVVEAVEIGKRHHPDLAIIDVRLADGGNGTDVVARLGQIGALGILYATGNIATAGLTNAIGHAALAKPYRCDDLLRALQIVAGIVATGVAAGPFPPGFQVLTGRVAVV